MLHRNINHRDRFQFNLKSRLKTVVIGILIASVGLVRQISREQVPIHWTGQPLYSFGLIAAGVFLVVFAATPSAWLTKLIGSPTFYSATAKPGPEARKN